MKKHIPNLITSLNVVSGTLSVFMAMYDRIELAAALILLAMVFDFFDGMAARLLHVKSEMGKELDSLADMVSFGVAPALLAHFLIKMTLFGGVPGDIHDLPVSQQVLLFSPLLIPAFSAYRLAKFNLDPRQTMSFIGMPTPANALFWVGLVFGFFYARDMYITLFDSIWTLVLSVVILSVLLVCELPMFSLKATGLGWKENKIRYCFLGSVIVFALIFGKATVMCVIPLYILFVVVEALSKAAATKPNR